MLSSRKFGTLRGSTRGDLSSERSRGEIPHTHTERESPSKILVSLFALNDHSGVCQMRGRTEMEAFFERLINPCDRTDHEVTKDGQPKGSREGRNVSPESPQEMGIKARVRLMDKKYPTRRLRDA